MSRPVGRPKGTPKSGGRKAGFNTAKMLREILAEKKFDVVQLLIGDLMQMEGYQRAPHLLRLMDFLYPKAQQSVDVKLTTEQLAEKVQEVLNGSEDEGTV